MNRQQIVYRALLPVPAPEAFAWHARSGAFERYNPPFDPVEILERSGGLTVGARTVIRVGSWPFRRRWTAEHTALEEGRLFRDTQKQGPFAFWEHTHLFEPYGDTDSILEDRIEYEPPLGSLGQTLGGHFIRHKLDSVFTYRQRTLQLDLAAHARYRHAGPLRFLVSGAGGLVGSTLTPFLTTGGHQVVPLRRRPPKEGENSAFWDLQEGKMDASSFEGFDAVVHLAGESIASGRWNAARKQRIHDSRVKGTKLLAETLAQLQRPPKVLICASAVGWYGSRGNEMLTEDSSPGTGFLAEVCHDWEAACQPAREAGIRMVNLRFGVILSPRGGALKQMLLPFRMGGGGVIGSGEQWLSWVAVDDVAEAILHAAATPALSGPVNVVAPTPVTNQRFTKTLGQVLNRPTAMPVPAFGVRLIFGEMGEELLLASQRVNPGRLIASGYRFRHANLEDALRHLLGKHTPRRQTY